MRVVSFSDLAKADRREARNVELGMDATGVFLESIIGVKSRQKAWVVDSKVLTTRQSQYSSMRCIQSIAIATRSAAIPFFLWGGG